MTKLPLLVVTLYRNCFVELYREHTLLPVHMWIIYPLLNVQVWFLSELAVCINFLAAIFEAFSNVGKLASLYSCRLIKTFRSAVFCYMVDSLSEKKVERYVKSVYNNSVVHIQKSFLKNSKNYKSCFPPLFFPSQ